MGGWPRGDVPRHPNWQASGYGFTGFSEKGIQTVTVGTKFIYRELLKKIVEMFKTGKSPLDVAETIEIVARLLRPRTRAVPTTGAQVRQ